MQNRIKELRKARGLTLEALARMVNSSNQHISHLENGRRRLTVDWIERIANALDCHPLELLDNQVLARTEREITMLRLFRALSEEQQKALVVATAALASPHSIDELVEEVAKSL
jgi:transcriptional regulator with XRE-family HTH domain